MGTWVKGIDAITLFVEDLPAARQFYQDVFDLPIYFEAPNSCVFQFGETVINLLDIRQAPELIEPGVVASREAGSRMVFTLAVDDVDAMCAELAKRGATVRCPLPPPRPRPSRSPVATLARL